MAFHRYGKTVKFPRNEDVEIHVRQVTLNADGPEKKQANCVEIREFLKEGEVYGHGIVIPAREVRDLLVALDKVVEPATPDKIVKFV